MLYRLILSLWFYISWFLCISLGNQGAFWSIAGVLIFYQLISALSVPQYLIWLTALLIGVLVDNLLLWTKVYIFPNSNGFVIPLWLWVLWFWFSLLTMELLSGLASLSWYWQMLIGGLGGTSSYMLGQRWRPKRLQFSLNKIWTMIIVFVIWAILFRLLLQLSQYYHHNFADYQNKVNPMINFTNLVLPNKPNFCLYYKALKKGRNHRQFIAPRFDIPISQLEKKWQSFIIKQPRVKLLQQNNDHYQYVEHSKLFHFPDLIDVKFIALGRHHSSLYLYSRSIYGYYDLGVNCQRLQKWLQAINS